MATTTNGGDSPTTEAPPSIAEDDKLGPLGGKTTVFDNEAELRRALVAEFLGAAESARAAAAEVDRDVDEAVHEYRKALRRARALLTLLARSLPRGERRAVKKALQEARRAVGTARDHAVAPDTLGALPLGEEERALATAVLDAAAESMPQRAEIKQLLAEGAARALAQVEALEAALPASVTWSSVVKGVCATYDEARSARKAAKRSKKSFHRWRRRSKELGYQLDVLAGFAGPHAAELHREIEGVTEAQGPVVDLIMLRDFVETHASRGEPLEHLLSAIDAQLEDLMKDARRAGKDVYRRKPRRFGRRLEKAVERDLAPAAADELS
jgi:CHAD domain-containing protein